MVWKENSLGHILEKWGVFSDFVTQYFVDIFSESLKSFFFTNKFRNCSIFNEASQNNRPSVSFYKDYWYQRTTQLVKFYGIGEFFSDFVMFFLHPQGDLFSCPLCRLHHQKKIQKLDFFFWKLNILLFRNYLAGPASSVKLAWKSRAQYLFEKNLLAFYIQPGQIFSNDFLSCFEWKYCAVSQNIIFMSFICPHFSNCKFFTFCSIDWFSFQKSLAIGPFRIRRCQDCWDKSLGWFLGLQCTVYRLLQHTEVTASHLSKWCNSEIHHEYGGKWYMVRGADRGVWAQQVVTYARAGGRLLQAVWKQWQWRGRQRLGNRKKYNV